MPLPEPMIPRLEAAELDTMIGKLSPASRAVVLLHYQEQQPLEEIWGHIFDFRRVRK